MGTRCARDLGGRRMRGGFCGGRTGASGRLRERGGQEPDDKLRFIRRKKESLRRGHAGRQGAIDETDWHGDMYGRFDVGVRSQRHLGGSRLQRGVPGAAGKRANRGDSSGKRCAKTVGKQVADELVRRCLQVSPGTHAPCNQKNSCKAMEEEIQRGCELLGANAPAFCGENK